MSSFSEKIEIIIEPRKKDLGGFTVGRILPFVHKRTVGPFVFLDHMGPAEFSVGEGMDVRPHPHIGLSTVTYLYEGSILHRDSLGSVQEIKPGDVNWMTAGRGIVHSERTPEALRKTGFKINGLQFWVALPLKDEECEPSFTHHASSALPVFDVPGGQVRLIAGELMGRKSPVKLHSPLFFFELRLRKGESFEFHVPGQEAGIYAFQGQFEIDGHTFGADQLPVVKKGEKFSVHAIDEFTGVFFGGEPFAEPRFIEWNFVSSSEDKIKRAKDSWRAQSFPKVPGETEFIPLP